jgi:hypothetical protein
MIGGKPSWSLIDDVENIDYREIDKETRQNSKFTPNYYIAALNKEGRIDENNQNYSYITAFKRNKTFISICSNMILYILNDQGQTIEKIN